MGVGGGGSSQPEIGVGVGVTSRDKAAVEKLKLCVSG